MTSTDEQVESGGIWSPAYLPVTLANLTVVAIAAFDGLALVAALPAIADDLGSVALLPWVITAFLATSAVAGITAGPIIDAIGVRRTFRVTGVWFLGASALAAVAPNMHLLVAARALQGIGGGLVISVALAAVGLAYPNRLRPRAFAANSMVWGVMGFGGPVVTAGLLALGSWRMIFIVQLPITALALAAGWRTLPSTRERPQRIAMDGVGIALVATLVGTSLLAVSQVGVRWWLAGAGAAVAILVGAAFWSHAGRSSNPLVERDHVTRFPLKRIHITSGLVLVAGLAADNYLPLYMQTTRGRSESFAAFSVVFLTVGWTAAAFVVSRLLDRWHASDTILIGAVLMLPALAVAGLGIALTWPIPVIFVGFFLMGASIGFVSTSGLTLLQSSAQDAEMGRVNERAPVRPHTLHHLRRRDRWGDPAARGRPSNRGRRSGARRARWRWHHHVGQHARRDPRRSRLGPRVQRHGRAAVPQRRDRAVAHGPSARAPYRWLTSATSTTDGSITVVGRVPRNTTSDSMRSSGRIGPHRSRPPHRSGPSSTSASNGESAGSGRRGANGPARRWREPHHPRGDRVTSRQRLGQGRRLGHGIRREPYAINAVTWRGSASSIDQFRSGDRSHAHDDRSPTVLRSGGAPLDTGGVRSDGRDAPFSET